MEKPFKPNLKWLQKVADGLVYSTHGYSPKKGATFGFVGGEETYKKHRAAGYVGHCPPAELFRRGVLQLTEKGKEALAGKK